MDLAEELNNWEKIDWEDDNQKKYTIFYDYEKNELDQGYKWIVKNLGAIHCLDRNFKEKAKEKIGEDKLKKLFKYERS